ncbi:MAG: transcriptional regulator [Thermoplasmata archaeon]|nr:transcriptional regulator [Thermoplasmata archaeon]
MKREELVQEAVGIFTKAGFSTSDPAYLSHSGFDMVARRGELIIVLKAVVNVDGINRNSLTGMLALTRAVDGTPLIIGAKKSSGKIEDGVVYSRFGIPLMSLDTLNDLFIEEVPPLVYSAPGGFFVRLDSEVLRRMRDGGISLGELAEIAGVSRRTIQMYEDGMGAKLSAALRLENTLGTELILPIDPLTYNMLDEAFVECQGLGIGDNDLAAEIFEHLNEIGYSVEPTSRCPFDALTSDRENLLFTGVGRVDKNIMKRARAMSNISKLLDRYSVFFVEERGSKTSLGGTPLISHVELEKIGDKKKILELINDRG